MGSAGTSCSPLKGVFGTSYISGTNYPGGYSMGRPPVGSTSLNVRMPPHELAALDVWIEIEGKESFNVASRPDAIRIIVAEWLKLRFGYIEHLLENGEGEGRKAFREAMEMIASLKEPSP